MQDYWSNIAAVDSYYRTNMDFLKPEVRNYFFHQYPDIYSKVDDLPPANTIRAARSATVWYPRAVSSTEPWKIPSC